MNKIYLIISTTLLALLLSACGGGGGGGDATFDSGNTKVPIVDCSTSTYTDIVVGDLLVKEDDSTTVTIVHNTNGTKRICVVSGSAHLLRDN